MPQDGARGPGVLGAGPLWQARVKRTRRTALRPRRGRPHRQGRRRRPPQGQEKRQVGWTRRPPVGVRLVRQPAGHQADDQRHLRQHGRGRRRRGGRHAGGRRRQLVGKLEWSGGQSANPPGRPPRRAASHRPPREQLTKSRREVASDAGDEAPALAAEFMQRLNFFLVSSRASESWEGPAPPAHGVVESSSACHTRTAGPGGLALGQDVASKGSPPPLSTGFAGGTCSQAEGRTETAGEAGSKVGLDCGDRGFLAHVSRIEAPRAGQNTPRRRRADTAAGS